jgi:hypothetical protein
LSHTARAISNPGHNSPTQAEAWNRLKKPEAWRRAQETKNQSQRELEANSTLQTRLKLRTVVIAALFAEGRLDENQRDAAGEIERVYHVITGSLFAKPSSFDKQPRGTPSETWPKTVTAAYHRYRLWCDDRVAQEILRPGLNVASLCIEIAVDNAGLRQCADRHGMDQRTVERRLKSGLSRYAELAGWTREVGPHRNIIASQFG